MKKKQISYDARNYLKNKLLNTMCLILPGKRVTVLVSQLAVSLSVPVDVGELGVGDDGVEASSELGRGVSLDLSGGLEVVLLVLQSGLNDGAELWIVAVSLVSFLIGVLDSFVGLLNSINLLGGGLGGGGWLLLNNIIIGALLLGSGNWSLSLLDNWSWSLFNDNWRLGLLDHNWSLGLNDGWGFGLCNDDWCFSLSDDFWNDFLLDSLDYGWLWCLLWFWCLFWFWCLLWLDNSLDDLLDWCWDWPLGVCGDWCDLLDNLNSLVLWWSLVVSSLRDLGHLDRADWSRLVSSLLNLLDWGRWSGVVASLWGDWGWLGSSSV